MAQNRDMISFLNLFMFLHFVRPFAFILQYMPLNKTTAFAVIFWQPAIIHFIVNFVQCIQTNKFHRIAAFIVYIVMVHKPTFIACLEEDYHGYVLLAVIGRKCDVTRYFGFEPHCFQ